MKLSVLVYIKKQHWCGRSLSRQYPISIDCRHHVDHPLAFRPAPRRHFRSRPNIPVGFQFYFVFNSFHKHFVFTGTAEVGRTVRNEPIPT